MASGATSHETAFSNQARTINLALQGGGAHGAFTWGVLDRLLEENDLGFEGLSATSAGAMNAAVFAYGLAVDGREGARRSRCSRSFGASAPLSSPSEPLVAKRTRPRRACSRMGDPLCRLVRRR